VTFTQDANEGARAIVEDALLIDAGPSR
jgi:hypothetical protein